MGRILFTIHDVMNQANFSGTYTRVVDGKQVVVKKGWKKRLRNVAIAAGAIGTTVGVLALLAARKYVHYRPPTIPVKPPSPPSVTTPKANQPFKEITIKDIENIKEDDWDRVLGVYQKSLLLADDKPRQSPHSLGMSFEWKPDTKEETTERT